MMDEKWKEYISECNANIKELKRQLVEFQDLCEDRHQMFRKFRDDYKGRLRQEAKDEVVKDAKDEIVRNFDTREIGKILDVKLQEHKNSTYNDMVRLKEQVKILDRDNQNFTHTLTCFQRELQQMHADLATLKANMRLMLSAQQDIISSNDTTTISTDKTQMPYGSYGFNNKKKIYEIWFGGYPDEWQLELLVKGNPRWFEGNQLQHKRHWFSSPCKTAIDAARYRTSAIQILSPQKGD